MKHLGGIGMAWFMLSGYPGLHTWLSTEDCVVVITWEITWGWPLWIKEINMSSMLRVLLVQPYDIMGSVLIE
jgi:hypothetical protein